MSVNGEAMRMESKPSSFVEIRRAWKDDRVRIELPKRLASERLPGSSDMYAFMDGPDLLAGLCSEERILYCDDPAAPEEDPRLRRREGVGQMEGRLQDSRPGSGHPLHAAARRRLRALFGVLPRRAAPLQGVDAQSRDIVAS